MLSPGNTNQRRDKQAKLKLYSIQAVDEYWIVNLNQQTVEVYRRENAVLKLAFTLYQQDELSSPILAGFSCLVNKFF